MDRPDRVHYSSFRKGSPGRLLAFEDTRPRDTFGHAQCYFGLDGLAVGLAGEFD
jgi:hypothetical protein